MEFDFHVRGLGVSNKQLRHLLVGDWVGVSKDAAQSNRTFVLLPGLCGRAKATYRDGMRRRYVSNSVRRSCDVATARSPFSTMQYHLHGSGVERCRGGIVQLLNTTRLYETLSPATGKLSAEDMKNITDVVTVMGKHSAVAQVS